MIKRNESFIESWVSGRISGKFITWITYGLAVAVIILALCGNALAPYDPLAVNTSQRFQPPGSDFWMGTDNLGRDMASRVIGGTRLAVQSCLIILASATFLGILIGLISGYYGGWVDELFMRISDVFIAFPGLVLAMAIAAALGPNLTNAMIAIAAVWWPSYARLVRGQVLLLKEQEFILATRALGGGDLRIMLGHLLPNLIVPLIIQITSDIGPALVTTSSLSFIGMGAQPPTPEWGSMVSSGRKYIFDYWWMSTFPGAAIFLTVLIFNGVGESLRMASER
jgi:peptide/nickel transport system permease protein